MKIQEYVISKQLRQDVGLLALIDDVRSVINFGRYQMRIVTAVPTHTGDAGEQLLYISGKTKRNYFYDPTNSAWNYPPTIVSVISLTGQTDAITTTTMFTPTAVGVYRVSVYMVCTTAGTGTLSCTIKWTDDYQAQQSSPASNVDLSGVGNAGSGNIPINATAAAITYETAIAGKAGSPEYSLYIVLEQLS